MARRISRPQNMGQNRNTQMRNNARRPGTFQGGLSRNPGVAPQGPMPSPAQGMQQCPPGQEPGIDAMGNKTCKPAQANIAGNVPVVNGQRATNPAQGKKY